MEPRSAANQLPVILTIAGFDPSSGAGITADLKTFAAHNCYGVAAITSLTVQTTAGVIRRQDVDPVLLREQILTLAADMPLAGVKVGMAGSVENVKAIAAALEQVKPAFVVIDPVLRSSSGAELLDRGAVDALTSTLLPKATVITPNTEEAAVLTGMKLQTSDEVRAAAAELHRLTGAGVVITGGHLDKPHDLFFDGSEYLVLAGERIRSANTHGTGCAFSAAIAANLAVGKSLADALVLAKAFVTRAIETGMALGPGTGFLNHLYRLQATPPPRAVATDSGAETHGAGHR